MFTRSQLEALDNLARSIDVDARLPSGVFTRKFEEVYAMDFRHLKYPAAVEIFKLLMKEEGSSVVVLGRFDRPKKESQDWRDDVFFVSPTTQVDEYMTFLNRYRAEYGNRRATPEMREPWHVFAERIGVCSNLGKWCIYGQMTAEIAVLGSDMKPTIKLEEQLYSEFRIEKLAEALKRDTFFGEPGNEYSTKQRAILRSAYLLH